MGGAGQGKFVVVAGTNLYTGGPTIPVTWTAVASAAGDVLTPGAMREFTGVSGIDTMYIAAGLTGLKSLDSSGTYTNSISSTPNVTGLEVYNQRLWGWFFGNSVGSNALFFSNLANAAGSIGGDSLGVGASGGGQINIQTFGQSGIITCRVIGASLIIFHIQGISRLTGFGQSDITVVPQALSADFSIVGEDAIAIHEGIGWAVGANGLYRITEGAISPVGTPSSPDPLTKFTPNQNVKCVYNPLTNEVWIASSGGVYAYHTILGSWSGPWNSAFSANPIFMSFPGQPLNNHPPYIVLLQPFDSLLGHVPPLQCDQTVLRDYVHSDGTSGQALHYQHSVPPDVREFREYAGDGDSDAECQ